MRRGHGRGRGGRRAARARPHRQRAPGARRGAAGPRGGAVPAQRHDVQRDRLPAAHARRPATRSCATARPHPIIAEAGGPAALAGAMLNPIARRGGRLHRPSSWRRPCVPTSRYMPRSRLVSVEQTTNISGGRVWPLDRCWRGRWTPPAARAARAPGRRAAAQRRGGLRRARARLGRPASTRPGSTSPRGSARRWARCSPARGS